MHTPLQDILRVLYPHALDKELAEMLTVVTRRKQVKGHDNLEQQMAELREVFAVYDDCGAGQLQQAEFVQAIMSAGPVCRLLSNSFVAAAVHAESPAHVCDISSFAVHSA